MLLYDEKDLKSAEVEEDFNWLLERQLSDVIYK